MAISIAIFLSIPLAILALCRWLDRRHPPEWTGVHELARKYRELKGRG